MNLRPALTRLRLCTLLLTIVSGATHAAALQVTVSIKPVHSLVAGIMQGIGRPRLLIEGNQSPHDFVLKPSDMRELSRADLIVWVGPDIETSLSRLFGRSELGARAMALTDLSDLTWLKEREGGEWAPHAQAHQQAEDAHPQNHDSHLWLSPAMARQIVIRVRDRLISLDGAHAEGYNANSQRLIDRLAKLDSRLQAELAPISARPYIVFHDAYHYLEQHYGLHAVGSVSISPERMPGARHVHALREKITRLHARCVFAEPQFEPKLLQTLVEGTAAKVGVLDPLGSDLTAGPDAYFQLMHRLAANLVECLQ